jgi:hypothetical protein
LTVENSLHISPKASVNAGFTVDNSSDIPPKTLLMQVLL